MEVNMFQLLALDMLLSCISCGQGLYTVYDHLGQDLRS